MTEFRYQPDTPSLLEDLMRGVDAGVDVDQLIVRLGQELADRDRQLEDWLSHMVTSAIFSWPGTPSLADTPPYPPSGEIETYSRVRLSAITPPGGGSFTVEIKVNGVVIQTASLTTGLTDLVVKLTNPLALSFDDLLNLEPTAINGAADCTVRFLT